jgi:hypothetical protein
MRTCKQRTVMLVSLPKQVNRLRMSKANLQNKLHVISFSLLEANPAPDDFMLFDL